MDFPFHDLRGQQRAQLIRSLNDDTCYTYTDSGRDAWFYGVRGCGILITVWLLALVWDIGYGDPLSGPGWNHLGMLLFYAVPMTALAFLVLGCVRRYRLSRRFGFRPGRYILPFSIIDARSDTLVVTDLMQLADLAVTHHTTNGRYAKTVFAFTMKGGKLQRFIVKSQRRAEQFHALFHAQQAETREAFAARDMDKLRLFDPLIDIRKNKWVLPPRSGAATPAAATSGVLGRLGRHHAVASVALALVLTPLLWLLRTAANDVATYRAAVAQNTEAAYLGYLERGYFHADAIRAALPRVSFNEAAGKNSVTALRAVLGRYPNAGLQQDVAAAIHVQYGRAMERFLTQAVRTDQSLIDAMQELLNLVEARGRPVVPIRFIRPTNEQLAKLDRELAQRGAVNGRQIIPAAEYFSDASAAMREARIATGLQNAFHSIFPNDVLTFVQSPRTKDGNGAADAKVQPVLDIRYDIEPSGALYVSEKEDGRGFVGLLVRFDSALITSDTAAQWRFNLEVKPPEHFTVEYKEGRNGGFDSALNRTKGPQAGQVYAVMAERAFDSLDTAIRSAFFRADSDTMMRNAGRVQRTQARTAPAAAPAERRSL